MNGNPLFNIYIKSNQQMSVNTILNAETAQQTYFLESSQFIGVCDQHEITDKKKFSNISEKMVYVCQLLAEKFNPTNVTVSTQKGNLFKGLLFEDATFLDELNRGRKYPIRVLKDNDRLKIHKRNGAEVEIVKDEDEHVALFKRCFLVKDILLDEQFSPMKVDSEHVYIKRFRTRGDLDKIVDKVQDCLESLHDMVLTITEECED